MEIAMPAKFPIRKCAACGEEFELKPDHPGFANRCIDCNEEHANASPAGKERLDADARRAENERNAHRREAMKNLLYRKDS
jgi:hypothetical protein